MPGAIYKILAEIAADQHGFVTTKDAASAGIDPDRLRELAARDQIERVTNSVYRIPVIPVTQLASYMQATLWPRKVEAFISHESALDLYGLSDVNPAKIHITVPRKHRPRRNIPASYVLHREDLDAEDVTVYEGIPVVTAAKAISQAHEGHLGPALIRQAIADGYRLGFLTRQQMARLEDELGVQV